MVQKRVFIGGLYPGVKEEELRQRFSSYGSISDIEIKVKRDAEGKPVKTFAYLDIEASDTDLHKCFRAYNKTKWKGIELSLQFAKENFIKRLEVERKDQLTSPDHSPSKTKKETKKSVTETPGVENFNMKGAVPGTSIPGHKDWTVGKYGSVLPVVNIRSKDKRKLLTIDPSKYTHNVKRIKDDQAQKPNLVNTDELTWELPDNDNDLTKKRKGEFPSWKSSKRKFEPEKDSSESDDDMEVVPVSDYNLNNSRLTNSINSGKNSLNVQKGTSVSKKKRVSLQTEFAKTNSLTKKDKTKQINIKNSTTEGHTRISDDGYDSGDTDEIIAVSKKNKHKLDMQRFSQGSSNSNSVIAMEAKIQINPLQEKLVSLAMPGNTLSRKSSMTFKDKNVEKENIKMLGDKKSKMLGDKKFKKLETVGNKHDHSLDVEDNPLAEFRGTRFLDDDNDSRGVATEKITSTNSHGAIKDMKDQEIDDSDLQTDSEDSDSDFEALIKKGVGTTSHSAYNAARPVIRTKDSKTQGANYNSDDVDADDDSDNDDDNNDNNNDDDDRGSVSSADTDEILLSSKSSKQTKVSKSDKKNKQQFIISALKLDEYSSGLNLDSETFQTFSKSESKNTSPQEGSDDESDFEALVKNELAKHKNKDKQQLNKQNTVTKRITEKEPLLQLHHRRNLQEVDIVKSQTVNSSPKKNLLENSNKGGRSSAVDTSEVNIRNKDVSTTSRTNADVNNSRGKDVLSSEDVDKKRQETVKQRQKEYLAQKSVIQKALANLDEGHSSNKKIIFDSDDDSDDKQTGGLEIKQRYGGDLMEKKTLGKSMMTTKKSEGIGLFDGSSDESSDEEQDGDMFKLRPEFQGPAGKKLMKLQSRYANDERFKLDTRFAEPDSEQEENVLEEEDEKRRQMKILASVLGTTAGITLDDKRDKAKKRFKDVSQLHFDPTKEEHSQFEIKSAKKPTPEKTEKKKKKKRSEEVETETDPQLELPEVSKERFFEVSDSVRDAFSKKSEAEPKGFSLLAAFGRRDSDSDEEIDEEATMKPFTATVDRLTLDSRFKVAESDSEQEENSDIAVDEDSGGNQTVSAADAVTDFVQPSTFFFTENDPRLKDGEKFYRTEDMETVRERWLEQRSFYMDSYTSKHKKFRRKLKTMQQFKPGRGQKPGGARRPGHGRTPGYGRTPDHGRTPGHGQNQKRR